jgi:diguanylate cyclase (GGDEF)-like protein/PAS domain S-box-containing protein
MTSAPHILSGSPQPELTHISKWVRFGYALPWLVLAAGLLITYLLWNSARETTAQERQDYFDFRVREVLEKTQLRLQTYTQVLRGAKGLFAASQSVERDEFRQYVNTLKLSDNFPGIQGVGYALAISPAELAPHIAAMRRQGFPEYTIRPEGKRELYTSIIYLEPFAERNLRAFGYDMYSEPVRHAAMARACDSGLPALSGKVQLVQEAQQNIQAGFLIYLPVYRNGMPHVTLAERRANLMGWVYAPFRMDDFTHGIYGERATDLDIDIFDGTEIADSSLMYDSYGDLHAANKPKPHFSATHQIEFAGHTWTLVVHSMPGFDAHLSNPRIGLIGGGGIITSLLLALLIWLLVNGRRRAVRLAQRMNHELLASDRALRESRGKLQAVLDSAAVGIAWADERGTIQYANHEFTRIFGYTLADIPTVEAWYRLAYPDADYRARMVAQWQTDIETARHQGTAIPPHEIDITCKDGSIRHVILTSAWVGTDILVSFSDITERRQNELQLQQWAQIFEHAEWGVVVGSTDGQHIELANPAFARARGYTMEELRLLPIPELFTPEERAALPERIRRAHEQGHATFESRHLRKDGSSFPVLVDITSIKDAQGQVLYRAVNVQDISQIKAAEKALQDSRTILQATLDNSPYLIWLKDTAGRFIAINQAFLDSTGKESITEVLGKTDADLWPEHLAMKYQADDAEVIASGRQKMTEEQALDKGRLVWMETFKTPVFDAAGELLGVTGFAREITERKLAEEKMRHQAYYDMLTELPNRVLFSDRLQQAIVHARREKAHLAVMFLDLDRFKPVNDVLGHDIGDILLREVARRILSCVRESDTVARIGGDEFCVLLPGIENEKDVAIVADKILHALRQPFLLKNHAIHIGCSIGIASYPGDGRDETTLLKNADIAMYWAKERGRDNFMVFNPELKPPATQE